MNEELSKEKIREHLASLKIKTTDQFLGWGIGIGLFSLISGLTLCFLFVAFTHLVLIILGPIIIGTGALVAYFCFCQIPKIKTNNQKILLTSGVTLHQIFFENLPNPFPGFDFKFEGIYPSTIWDYNCLHFSLNGETIVWDVDEDVEMEVTGSDRNSGVTAAHLVYVLKYNLFSTTKRLKRIKQVWISQTPATKKNDQFFQFESLEFNQRFKVKSTDPLDAYKIFTPKIIENFLHVSPSFLGLETINLQNNCVSINRQSLDAAKSWAAQPLDYSKVRWSKRRMVGDILQKLETDFGRYREIQQLLFPLDLY